MRAVCCSNADGGCEELSFREVEPDTQGFSQELKVVEKEWDILWNEAGIKVINVFRDGGR